MKLLITGAYGMVGSRLKELITDYKLLTPDKNELDITNQHKVWDYFCRNSIDYVVHLAGLVGGIQYNIKYPANMLAANASMAINIINTCHYWKPKKLIFVGSCCMYPVKQGLITESDILTGPPEKTNEAYAIAKILGVKLCEYYNRQYEDPFISIIPCNVYGKVNNEPLEKNHAISAVMKKIHVAKKRDDKEIEIFGTGTPTREYIHRDDLCKAIIFLLDKYNDPEPINVGSGEFVTINYLTEMIMKVVGYKGKIIRDTSKDDGSPYKCIDSSKIRSLGWYPKIGLEEGLKKAYADYIND